MSNNSHHHGIDAGVRSLFETSQFSDLEIHCRDRIFKVHKAILACQGGFFSIIGKNGFQEDEKKSIKLHEDDPDIILSLLQYLYGMEYNTPEETEKAVFQANLYAAADFYQLPLLKKIASAISRPSRDRPDLVA
ncbi:MAG: hypothetical protein Q9162_000926 [Coniocarpon cinnabarinum]